MNFHLWTGTASKSEHFIALGKPNLLFSRTIPHMRQGYPTLAQSLCPAMTAYLCSVTPLSINRSLNLPHLGPFITFLLFLMHTSHMLSLIPLRRHILLYLLSPFPPHHCNLLVFCLLHTFPRVLVLSCLMSRLFPPHRLCPSFTLSVAPTPLRFPPSPFTFCLLSPVRFRMSLCRLPLISSPLPRWLLLRAPVLSPAPLITFFFLLPLPLRPVSFLSFLNRPLLPLVVTPITFAAALLFAPPCDLRRH